MTRLMLVAAVLMMAGTAYADEEPVPYMKAFFKWQRCYVSEAPSTTHLTIGILTLREAKGIVSDKCLDKENNAMLLARNVSTSNGQSVEEMIHRFKEGVIRGMSRYHIWLRARMKCKDCK